MTPRRLFHHERWSDVIKPKVVARMKKKYPEGPHTSKHPKWLKVMRRVETRIWLTLPDEDKEDYEKRAMEMNSGDNNQRAKAE